MNDRVLTKQRAIDNGDCKAEAVEVLCDTCTDKCRFVPERDVSTQPKAAPVAEAPTEPIPESIQDDGELCSTCLGFGDCAACYARYLKRRAAPATEQAKAEPTDRAPALADLAYVNGFKSGWMAAEAGNTALIEAVDRRLGPAIQALKASKASPAKPDLAGLTAGDRETVLGLIAWLGGAAQGDRPSTSRGEAAAALQRALAVTAKEK